MKNLHIIVCIAQNRAIGLDNHLLYRLKDDLRQFKALITGHTVIMGRRTFESLPKGALPNRRNLVLTRQTSLNWPNTETFPSLKEALSHCSNEEQVFIIGGSSVYAEALPQADTLHLTLVDNTPKEADTFFPEINKNEWEETERTDFPANENNEHSFSLVTLKRKP